MNSTNEIGRKSPRSQFFFKFKSTTLWSFDLLSTVSWDRHRWKSNQKTGDSSLNWGRLLFVFWIADLSQSLLSMSNFNTLSTISASLNHPAVISVLLFRSLHNLLTTRVCGVGAKKKRIWCRKNYFEIFERLHKSLLMMHLSIESKFKPEHPPLFRIMVRHIHVRSFWYFSVPSCWAVWDSQWGARLHQYDAKALQFEEIR